jgi:hypothetical protein
MRDAPGAVDDPPKMIHTLPADTDQLDALLARAIGGLDGELGTIADPDPEQSPARHREVLRMRTRVLAGEYEVDPRAVADAIVERVRPAGRAAWRHLRAA